MAASGVAQGLARLRTWADGRGLTPQVAQALERAADPALAAANLEALLASGREPRPELLESLLRILGASQTLASTLLSVPGATLEWLESALGTERVSSADHVAELRAAAAASSDPPPVLLRRHKRRHVLRIGGRDLVGRATVSETVRELSALADGAIEVAADFARSEVARDYGEIAPGDRLRFAVLAMGKLGGEELNFSSDIDLVYLFDGGRHGSSGGPRGTLSAPAYAARIAETLTRTLSEVTDDGFVFRVDLRLRPDGQNGPIVNSLGAALTYYESFGQTWERAAMLKARSVGPDVELGGTFLAEMSPFVYRRFLDFATVEEIEEMKARVDGERSHDRLVRDVKLGPGGIREVEFVVQALTLVHGGRDERLRTRSTLRALAALAEVNLIPEAESQALARAYRFLRDVEHKLQIVNERQTQTLPADPEEERLLARRLGYHLRPGAGEASPAEVGAFRSDLGRHRRSVRRSFERLFFGARSTIARADEAARALFGDLENVESAREALAGMGFRDPVLAIENLKRLRDGPSFSPSSPKRRKALYGLAPALLTEIRKASDPDLALRHMAAFVSAIGARTSFLALLQQNPETLRLLVGLFGSSEFLSNFFLRHPELLDSLVRADLATVRKDRSALDRELAAVLSAAPDYEAELDALRRFRNEEFLRIGVNDIHGLLDFAEVSEELSKLAEACLEAALGIAMKALAERFGPPPGRFAVVAMGTLGGQELAYNSDLDLIFIYDGRADAEVPISVHEYFTKLAQRLMVVLQLTTREGIVYRIDTRLRPSGSHGPLVSSLGAFRAYHRTSSALWERQALIRARGVAGDRFLIAEVERVIEDFVYGQSLSPEDVVEIRRMRGRMEQELSRETDEKWNVKTGRGGIVDVEFLTQALQLRHGVDHPAVRRRRTLHGLDALHREGLLPEGDHRALLHAYVFLRRVENRLRIERDQAVESFEPRSEHVAALARRLGHQGPAEAVSAALRGEIQAAREAIRELFDRYFSVALVCQFG